MGCGQSVVTGPSSCAVYEMTFEMNSSASSTAAGERPYAGAMQVDEHSLLHMVCELPGGGSAADEYRACGRLVRVTPLTNITNAQLRN